MIETLKDLEEAKDQMNIIAANLMSAINTASLAHAKVPDMVAALSEMRTYYANLDIRLQAIEARITTTETKTASLEAAKDDGK